MIGSLPAHTPAQLEEIAQALTDSSQIGSNTWAITPQRSASGHALLFINPHQPFFGPGQWIEGHLHSGSGWNMSGASFPGSPFPTLGHNEYLGWSHTVNDPDIVDTWAEKFDDPTKPSTMSGSLTVWLQPKYSLCPSVGNGEPGNEAPDRFQPLPLCKCPSIH